VAEEVCSHTSGRADEGVSSVEVGLLGVLSTVGVPLGPGVTPIENNGANSGLRGPVDFILLLRNHEKVSEGVL